MLFFSLVSALMYMSFCKNKIFLTCNFNMFVVSSGDTLSLTTGRDIFWEDTWIFSFLFN